MLKFNFILDYDGEEVYGSEIEATDLESANKAIRALIEVVVVPAN